MKPSHGVAGALLLTAALAMVWPPPIAAAFVGYAATESSAGQAKPTSASLDPLLAPIALYPDALLAQLLVCAGKPSQVVELSGWLKKNPSLKGTALQDAAQNAGFEPSYVALALFPQVVDMMAADAGWTRQVGEAFAADRDAVFDSIQRLRAQSQEVGNLKSTPQQTVETKTTQAGQQVIVIEPANPQIVYVPQYNPQVVYTQAPSTVVVQQSNTGAAVAAGAVGFAAGIAIGAAIDNDHYYGPYGWRGGGYMYHDAWEEREDAREDYYEHREDAREDYSENRQNVANERTERANNAQQQRTERANTAQQQSTERQQARSQSGQTAQASAQQARASGASAQQARSTAGATAESRGYSRDSGQAATARSGQAATARSGQAATARSGQAATARSGTKSDAFSNYSSGKSERAASSRGQQSRSSSRGGGGRRR